MAANVITGLRIVFSMMLLFFPALSPAFYGLYLVAGFTDMIDGTVARKMGTESVFGAKLDTIADMIFVAVAAVKLLPLLEILKGIWIWICVIFAIKVINIISGFIVEKRFVSVHSLLNKATGLLLFLLPISFVIVKPLYAEIIVCVVATIAAIGEGHNIRTGKAKTGEKK